MERQKFEDSIQEAFKEAEVAPSNLVWTNVELDLERASGGDMKRRLLFFQLLAAASTVFALGIAGVYYLNTKSAYDQPLVQQEVASTSEGSDSGRKESGLAIENSASNKLEENKMTNSVEKGIERKPNFNNENSLSVRKGEINTALVSTVGADTQRNVERTGLDETFKNRPLPRLIQVEQPKLVLPTETEPDPGLVLLARLEEDVKRLNQNEKAQLKEKIWTSVGVGAGSYNPQSSSSGTLSAGIGGPSATSSNPTAGTSYSVGLSLAGKLSRRVVLQGGVSYLTQNAEFTSSAAVGQSASLNEFAVSKDASVATSPYKVNSNLQYLSVPLQAGYIILDRSFGIQLNGGLSTDLFLQNTLTPQNGKWEESTQGAGSDSPYRTVNFSGLMGTEFSYKVGDHYRIAVNPGLRYALNSIYKSEVDTEMSPTTFDVSLRFRYIFK